MKLSSFWILVRRLVSLNQRQNRGGNGSDKRRLTRKPLPVTVVIRMSGSTPMVVRAIDISVGGIGIMTPQLLSDGLEVRVIIEMFFRGKMRRAAVNARVANCIKIRPNDFKTGLKFDNLGVFESALFKKYVET